MPRNKFKHGSLSAQHNSNLWRQSLRDQERTRARLSQTSRIPVSDVEARITRECSTESTPPRTERARPQNLVQVSDGEFFNWQSGFWEDPVARVTLPHKHVPGYPTSEPALSHCTRIYAKDLKVGDVIIAHGDGSRWSRYSSISDTFAWWGWMVIKIEAAALRIKAGNGKEQDYYRGSTGKDSYYVWRDVPETNEWGEVCP